MTKVKLSPGSGGNFGFSAGGIRASANVNPIPYLAPWILAVALAGLAVAIRFGLAHDSASWYWSTLTALVYIGLTWVTWRSTRPRGQLTCLLATGGVAAAGVWSWLVAGMPHLTWRPFVLYGLLAVLGCGGANVFTAFKHGHGEPGSGMFDKLGGALEKVRAINEITAEDGQVQASYRMQPGTPASELQDSTTAIASMYGLPPDGVRAIPSKDDAAEGKIVLSPNNPLALPPVWPGPSMRSGGSVMDPLVLGVRRGGQPLQYWMPGDPSKARNASLMTLVGMSGSGKTQFIRLQIIEGVLSRGTPDEVEYWYGNSRKADQEPDWVKRGAARFENTRKGVAQMLKDLRDELPERARILGEQGLDQWQPGCGLAFKVVFCDEFADIAKDIESIVVDLAETVRSLGIHLVLGLQRASSSRFPTDARSNFNTQACLGVRDDTDAEMALPEDVLDAGAQPWLWGAKVPGMLYMAAPGVDEELWSEAARTFFADKHLLARWAEHYIALRERGIRAGGRPSPHLVSVPTGEQAVAAARRATNADAVPIDMDDDDEDVDGVVQDADASKAEELGDVDERELADEIDDILTDLDDGGRGDLDGFDDELPEVEIPAEEAEDLRSISVSTPIEVGDNAGGMRLRLSPTMTPAEARAYVRRWFTELHGRGVGLIKKEDMGDLLADIGFRSSWLDKVLKEFCGEQPAWLRRTDSRGWYEILAAPPVLAGAAS
ncbi:MAG: hypothetical protein HOV87_12265 [Catenulispora sp.]|nr:hypothetical protein [Catenulispora sp.]NUT39978.1 hypothetical protein [Thermoactinospora sp.]